MEFWQALILAAVPSVAAVATALIGFRDLGLRRKLQTSEQFLVLFTVAHGRPNDGRAVGITEQVAALHLIADFAKKEPLLMNAARAGLEHFATWENADISGAATEAVKRLG